MYQDNIRPVIIVFDSLGLKHNLVFKTLRDYLVDEAKSKRGMDLSKDDIAGLHAKVESIQAHDADRRSLDKVITAIVGCFCYIMLRSSFKILIDIYQTY